MIYNPRWKSDLETDSTLTSPYRFNLSIAGVVWPGSLEQLSFDEYFNQPIVGVAWPASLQQLAFAGEFNHDLAEVVWPASLQELLFGLCGRRRWSSYRSGISLISKSSELHGRPPCSSYHSRVGLTSPSLELRGRPPCTSYRSGTDSTSLSSEVFGRPRCDTYRSVLVQPAHHRSCVAGFTAATVVRPQVQSVHRGNGVAHFFPESVTRVGRSLLVPPPGMCSRLCSIWVPLLSIEGGWAGWPVAIRCSVCLARQVS